MFKNEETGIIFKDDIMTNPSFFTFMELMLDKYKSFYKDIHQWDIEFYKLLYSLFQKGQYAAASKYNLTQCLPSVGYHTNNDVEQYIKQYEIDFKNFKIPEKLECSEEYTDCYIGVHIYRHIFNKYGFRPDLKGIRENIKKEKRFLNKLMFKN